MVSWSACGTSARSSGHPADVARGIFGYCLVQPVQRGIGRALALVGRLRLPGEDDGLDQAVDAGRLGGEGDHAKGGEQAKLLIDARAGISAPDNETGNVIGRIAGQHPQQPDRAGVAAADRLDGDIPQPGDGPLRLFSGGSGVHADGVLAELFQVGTGGDAGLGDVGGGLVQRQRQIPQLGRHRRSSVTAVLGGLAGRAVITSAAGPGSRTSRRTGMASCCQSMSRRVVSTICPPVSWPSSGCTSLGSSTLSSTSSHPPWACSHPSAHSAASWVVPAMAISWHSRDPSAASPASTCSEPSAVIHQTSW